MNQEDNQTQTQAASAEASAADAAPKSLEDLLADAEARVQEQKDAWLRALADAENARKRSQAEIASARKFAVEGMAENLLPVIDSLEAALADTSSDPAALRNGVELTLRQLKSAFEKAGIAEIAPAEKARFDPNQHQAMAAVEAEADPNTVVSVLQKGYTLKERVLRPALVTVAKAKS